MYTSITVSVRFQYCWKVLHLQADLQKSMYTFEQLHGKTYNFDWRHNLLKQRHNFVEKIPK